MMKSPTKPQITEEIRDEGLIEFILTLGLTPPRRNEAQNFLS